MCIYSEDSLPGVTLFSSLLCLEWAMEFEILEEILLYAKMMLFYPQKKKKKKNPPQGRQHKILLSTDRIKNLLEQCWQFFLLLMT